MCDITLTLFTEYSRVRHREHVCISTGVPRPLQNFVDFIIFRKYYFVQKEMVCICVVLKRNVM